VIVVFLCPCTGASYPAHYSDVMDMFRAVLRSNELSRRTLLLSEAVIDCNSANYSAWHFRRLCLERLDSDLAAELEWVATVALDTPKNYQ
jgi:protein farnesyltransferase/geranylgeranyltransferase type-1 subunit alpha